LKSFPNINQAYYGYIGLKSRLLFGIKSLTHWI